MTTTVAGGDRLVCTGCGKALTLGARFCSSCGTPVASTQCPSCSAPVMANARFCPDCGAELDGAGPAPAVPLRPVAERRVTSVLFGDLVGFTPLSEARDAEDVRELLSQYFEECRAIIARYGGLVEKFIGDAVMAVWGAPTAHEDDAERAVRAGLELAAAIAGMGEDVGAPGLAMRVGIVTGEVAVTIGADAEGLVAGDSVNTAARVQSVAEPGQVWVDGTTRTLASSAVAFEDAGSHALKGKSEPLQLFRATAVLPGDTDGLRADGLQARMLGRGRELRMLKEYFHSAEESHRPVLVVVDGEAGIGKSRLAWEFEQYIDGLALDVAWHRGRSLSYGSGVAFRALAEALRPRLGLLETSGAQALEDALDDHLPSIVPDEEEREWMRPRLAALLGSSEGTDFRREDLFSAWTTFLERVGTDRPVVLVLDDMQYADDGLLDYLDHLLATARSAIFVLALARPELLDKRPALGGRRATIVRLDALDDATMGILLDDLVTGLPTDARRSLIDSADGVPLYLVEAVRSLIDRNGAVPTDARYAYNPESGVDVAGIGAPPTLQALVAARLDALSAEERRVVSHASVLGQSFTRDGLAYMTHPDTAPEAPGLDDVLSTLQRKEIFTVQQDRFSAEHGQYRFVQSVVRQVAYAMQSKRDRKARHLAAARYLESVSADSGDLAVVIAQHLIDAIDSASHDDTDGPELTVRAVRMLELAAARARALGAPADAFRLLESAAQREIDPHRRASLLLASAEVAHLAGQFEVTVGRAREAMTWFDDNGYDVDAGWAAGVIGSALTSLEENAAAIELCEPRWRALDGRSEASRALVPLVRVLGSAYGFRGDQDKAGFYGERGLILAEASHDPAALVTTQVHLGIRYQGIGAPQTARVLFTSAADIARAHDRPMELAISLNNLGTVQLPYDLRAALLTFEESMEMARRSGSSSYRDVAVANYALALWTSGRLADLSNLIDQELEAISLPGIRVHILNTAAWLAVAQGRPLPGLPDDITTDAESVQSVLGCLRLTHALLDGDHVAARAIASESIGPLLAAAGLEDDFMHLWPPLVLGALEAGDVDLADRLLEPVRSAPQGSLSTAVKAQYLRLRALVAAAQGGNADEIEADLVAAIAALDEYGAVSLTARVHEELGRWLLDQGRPDDADEHLEAARVTYTLIDANGWLQQLPGTAASAAATTAGEAATS